MFCLMYVLPTYPIICIYCSSIHAPHAFLEPLPKAKQTIISLPPCCIFYMFLYLLCAGTLMGTGCYIYFMIKHCYAITTINARIYIYIQFALAQPTNFYKYVGNKTIAHGYTRHAILVS